MSKTVSACAPSIPLEPRFSDLVPSATLRVKLEQLGFTTPTPVQAQTLPLLFAGRNVVAQAKTGSGKTLAFSIPMLAYLEKNPEEIGTLALVLAPTRELATQISSVIASLSDSLQPVVLIGGMSAHSQRESLRRDRRVVVGTPGRILDFLQSRDLMLRKCRFFVVDEADEMFSMDFEQDVRSILGRLPDDRQGVFMSATLSPRVEDLANTFIRDRERIVVETPQEALPSIEHWYYNVGQEITAKASALCDLLDVLNPTSAVIFCNTKSDTELVEVFLKRRGYNARLINSDLDQKQRNAVMDGIRNGNIRFLIGTDIAARGIDVSHIELVVNYALPEQSEMYIHRTGRTGRAGREGVALSLISPHDFAAFQTLKREVPITLEERTLPSVDEVLSARLARITKKVENLVPIIQDRDTTLAQIMVSHLEQASSKDEAVKLLARTLRFVADYEVNTQTPKSDAVPSNSSTPAREHGHQRESSSRRHSSRERGRGGGSGRSRRR